MLFVVGKPLPRGGIDLRKSVQRIRGGADTSYCCTVFVPSFGGQERVRIILVRRTWHRKKVPVAVCVSDIRHLAYDRRLQQGSNLFSPGCAIGRNPIAGRCPCCVLLNGSNFMCLYSSVCRLKTFVSSLINDTAVLRLAGHHELYRFRR